MFENQGQESKKVWEVSAGSSSALSDQEMSEWEVWVHGKCQILLFVLEWWIFKQWHLLWAVGGEEWYTCIENQQNWRAVQDLKFWVNSLYYYLDCSSYSFSAPQAITHVSLEKGHCLQWTRVYPSSPTPHNGEADRHNERASAHYISPNPAFSIQSWKAAMQISGAWNLSTPGGI